MWLRETSWLGLATVSGRRGTSATLLMSSATGLRPTRRGRLSSMLSPPEVTTRPRGGQATDLAGRLSSAPQTRHTV